MITPDVFPARRLCFGRSLAGRRINATFWGGGRRALLLCGPFSDERFGKELLSRLFAGLRRCACERRRYENLDLASFLTLRTLVFCAAPCPDESLSDRPPRADPARNFNGRFAAAALPGGAGLFPESEPESRAFAFLARTLCLRAALFFEGDEGLSAPEDFLRTPAAKRLSDLAALPAGPPLPAGSAERWLWEERGVPALRLGAASFGSAERALDALRAFFAAFLTL